MATHNLKISPQYFKAVLTGAKKFEFRINDRNYKVNDILLLQEYIVDDNIYTGKAIPAKVTYILDVSTMIATPGKYVIMSIQI